MPVTPVVLRENVVVRKDRSGSERLPISTQFLAFIAAATEGAVIVLCAVTAAAVYHSVVIGELVPMHEYVAAGLLYALLYVERMYARGFYALERLATRPLRVTEILRVWVTVAALFAMIIYLGKFGSEISRGVFILFVLLTPAGVFVTRAAVQQAARRAVDRKIVQLKRVLLVGEPREVYNHVLLKRLRASGYCVSEIIATQFDEAPSGFRASEIIARVRRDSVDEILVCASWSRLREFGEMLTLLRVLPLPVLVIADQRVRTLLTNPVTQIGSVLAVEVQRGPLSMGEQALKRALDFVAATVALAVLMPVLALIGILVRLDSQGSALFRQTRVGFSGRAFKIYKFRTMTTLDDGGVVHQATRHDKRVTRIGSFLRRTSIDELPQLLNVLRGEMSLVGPRPHASAHDDEYTRVIAKYAYRHHMKPGITGWAQVNGCRGETSTVGMMEQRVDCDLWYINNWSIWLDLKTILMTVVQVWKHDAY